MIIAWIHHDLNAVSCGMVEPRHLIPDNLHVHKNSQRMAAEGCQQIVTQPGQPHRFNVTIIATFEFCNVHIWISAHWEQLEHEDHAKADPGVCLINSYSCHAWLAKYFSIQGQCQCKHIHVICRKEQQVTDLRRGSRRIWRFITKSQSMGATLAAPHSRHFRMEKFAVAPLPQLDLER